MRALGHIQAAAGALVAALALALVACALIPAGAPAASRPSSPPRSIYWGAWIGDQMTGTKPPWDMSGVSAFEGVVDKGLSLIGLSSPFADCPAGRPCTFFPFPTQAMENARDYGAIPVSQLGVAGYAVRPRRRSATRNFSSQT